MNKQFIISRYMEDYKWISKYTKNFIIYNKGLPILDDKKIRNVQNIGSNQRDIFYFAFNNYNSLPDIMIFIQAFPFDHCKEEVFKKLIQNNFFTPIEYYENSAFGAWSQRDYDGGYMEINNSWYIDTINNYYKQTCRYHSFDQFMNKYFENYKRLEWIRFTPGSQYIVEKKQILQYPKLFWEKLMNELDSKTPTEGHIIERALYYIFTGAYKLKEEVYE